MILKRHPIFFLMSALIFTACQSGIKSAHVWLTSEAGDKCTESKAVVFRKGTAADAVVVRTDEHRQTIEGFGGSLTESSAFVLACLTKEQRQSILSELFASDGANFSLTRTQIGASDFSVEGCYSLAEQDGDVELLSFSLDRDKEGFTKEKYPQVNDENYDLYHLMKDVWAIKQQQTDKTYRIIANTWTAPAWMKQNKKYYERENGFHRGGALLPEYYQTYADYITKYVEAWKQEGVDIYAVTPVNEPMGNDGGWESMDFPPEAEAEFIACYLGPTLQKKGLGNVLIYGFDQNIGELPPYADAIYGNEKAREYTAGMAVHWYGSTVSCLPHVLDSIHALYPDKTILHTEGCIDNLGCPGWSGVGDYDGYQESDWFMNDSFWWTPSATDWAYSTQWAGGNHPKYAPVHRYARYIIDGMNHWMTGFCDWNIVLDSIGGPNHVANYCGAEVMVDYIQNKIYYTPYYYALKQFSRSMRPGDTVLGITEPADTDLHVCAVLKQDGSYALNMLNESETEKPFCLQIADYYAEIIVPANSVETIIVKL